MTATGIWPLRRKLSSLSISTQEREERNNTKSQTGNSSQTEIEHKIEVDTQTEAQYQIYKSRKTWTDFVEVMNASLSPVKIETPKGVTKMDLSKMGIKDTDEYRREKARTENPFQPSTLLLVCGNSNHRGHECEILTHHEERSQIQINGKWATVGRNSENVLQRGQRTQNMIWWTIRPDLQETERCFQHWWKCSTTTQDSPWASRGNCKPPCWRRNRKCWAHQTNWWNLKRYQE